MLSRIWDFLVEIDPIVRYLDGLPGSLGKVIWCVFWVLFFLGCCVAGAIVAELGL